MNKLIAEINGSQFWHGDSLKHIFGGNNVLVVTDPPMELASSFLPAIDGCNNFVIFAGLRGRAAIVANKLITCQEFVRSWLKRDDLPEVALHTVKQSNSFRPQYVISRNYMSTTLELPNEIDIYSKDCEDGLTPEFVAWSILQYVDIKQYDTIYDPFCGNGSTALAAHMLGLKFIGCDIDRDRVITASRQYAGALVGDSVA